MKTSEKDPELIRLLRDQETLFNLYRRALVSLRDLYLNTDSPVLSEAARLQQRAHDLEYKLRDANRKLSDFAWEIVPYNKDKDHLEHIRHLREKAHQRINKTKEQKYPVVIITTINGIKKRFIE